MKLLIFLLLLGLFLSLLYWRLRPYIAAARRVLVLARDMRSVIAPEQSGSVRRPTAAAEKLVRCQTCGTWTPAARAIALGGRGGPSNHYCSHACLERAAGEDRQPRAANRKQR